MDRLTSMAVFTRIVEASSFSGAARSLGISQATASKHVQMLEEWLGARLLNRTTRRVGMTEIGKSFYAQCTQILADIDDAKRASKSEIALRGSLRVAVAICFGSTLFGALLHGFTAENPELTIEVFLTDRAIDPQEDGFDLSIRFGVDAMTGAVVRRLAVFPQSLCASPEYLSGREWPEDPVDLVGHRCLLDQLLHPAGWQFIGPAGRVAPRLSYVITANNVLLLRDAALAGAGICMIPDFAVGPDFAAGRLVRLMPEWKVPVLELSAIIPAGRQASAKILALTGYVAERLATPPDGVRGEDEEAFLAQAST